MDMECKIVPRKRVANFTPDEKVLLAQLVKKRPVVESKLTDGRAIARKQTAWDAITQEFNSNAYVHKRETSTLKRAWDNMKALARKSRATERGNLLRTGGGPHPPPPPPQHAGIISLVEEAAPVMICEVKNAFDSDGVVLLDAMDEQSVQSDQQQTSVLVETLDTNQKEDLVNEITWEVQENDSSPHDTNAKNSQDYKDKNISAVRRPTDYIRREAMMRIKHFDAKKKIDMQTLRTKKLDGDVMNICQQSVSRIIARVTILIASKMKDFVKFPSTASEINTVKQSFYEIAHFPGVIGCIDCTHIKIRSPGGITSEVYRNRKGWFSINVQAITGPNLEFYDVVARWPGSTHDSFIYNSSAIKQRLNTGLLQGLILGDSGYAVSDVLLTPFLSPNSTPQENYNRSHIKTRNTIERCFGVWKRRFPCLQVGMSIKVDKIVAVICACATLHNIAVMVNDMVPSEGNNSYDDVEAAPILENHNNNGFTVHQSLVERFFS